MRPATGDALRGEGGSFLPCREFLSEGNTEVLSVSPLSYHDPPEGRRLRGPSYLLSGLTCLRGEHRRDILPASLTARGDEVRIYSLLLTLCPRGVQREERLRGAFFALFPFLSPLSYPSPRFPHYAPRYLSPYLPGSPRGAGIIETYFRFADSIRF